MNEALDELRTELGSLDPALKARLDGRGFDPEWLVRLAEPLAIGPVSLRSREAAKARREERNRVSGAVAVPNEAELRLPPEPRSEAAATLAAHGRAALERGEVAFCVMAGGMATRMGGVVKALVRVVAECTFLDLRLQENAFWGARSGHVVPLWLMTSEATEGPIRAALEGKRAPAHVKTFEQNLGLRLTPDGTLFRDDAGHPSTYATGHGDLVDALRRSGYLRAFRERGGKYVWITNVDNLGATIDEVLLGMFLDANVDVQVEVVKKVKGDRGGIPVHAAGKLQVLEEFRLPVGFDAAQVRVFNTNTFLVRADALDEAPIAWNWFEVEKTVADRRAVQYERLLQELTAALRAGYVRVPREGAASRFLPVKDPDELERRRGAIAAVARSRGMLQGET